jgi:multicomponent Na+:H+ antiporter subunit E
LFVALQQKSRAAQESADTGQRRPRTPRKSTLAPYVLTFIFTFVTWVVLSGKLDAFHLSLGVISCLIVAVMSGRILLPSPDVYRLPGQWARFITYVPWLLYQIFLANIHVTKLVFHPRMRELINPQMITFNSRLSSEMSRFVFANSITLTPGTITVYVSILGKFSVHAIDDASAGALPGEMEERVAGIFEE